MDLSELKQVITEISSLYTESTDVKYLKKHGQFFTVHESILDSLFGSDQLPNESTRPLEVLEPSCGTGMIILECLRRIRQGPMNITGVEIDAKLAEDTAQTFREQEDVEIITADFLKWDWDDDKQYDLIIGNPPYFEMRREMIDRDRFNEVMCGRTNIYTLFLYKSIQMLREGGELRFIIPQTVLSGKYFSRIRAYIEQTCEILDIVKFSKNNLFDRALQSVIVLKLRRCSSQVPRNNKYMVRLNDEVYFVRDRAKLGININTDTNIQTIGSMGCSVKTGSVAWNQFKEYIGLNDTSAEMVPLVMAANLKTGKIVVDGYMKVNERTRKYVQHGPFIAINRIVGLNPPKLNIVFERESTNHYFIENHVNIVRAGDNNIEKLQTIYESLKKQETLDFLEELLGSTQLSQHELQNIVPIF
jgi:adenine-specific DNA-methyltransferase